MGQMPLTPEKEVLDALNRMEELGLPFCAVLVKISKLLPENRGYRQLEILSKLFEPLLHSPNNRLFLLSNYDFLLLCAQPSLEVIDDVLFQIKSLFSDDPFVQQEPQNFNQIFFSDKHLNALKNILNPQRTPKNKKPTTDVPTDESSPHLTLEGLERLTLALQRVNTLDFIKRQAVVDLSYTAPRKVSFFEYYTSLFAVQQKLAQGISLTQDKPLFYQLTETLDKKMLAALPNLNLFRNPKIISLNLNLSSLGLPIFEKTVKALKSKVYVELQIADIFENTEKYFEALTRLHKVGHKVILDGVTVQNIDYIYPERMKADFIKIFWSPAWMEEKNQSLLSDLLKKYPVQNVIFARCDSEQAVRFGQKLGLRLFQGHFIDAILALLAKNSCTFGQECSVSACMQCRAALSGPEREQCVHQRHLDADLNLKVI